MPNFDVNKINAAFRQSLEVQQGKPVHPDAEKVQTFLGIPGTGTVAETQATFCAAWPKAYDSLKVALKLASWVLPQASMARAALDAINSEVVPLICGPKS